MNDRNIRSNQCACAHSRVLLKPIDHPNGTRSDHWECSDCGTEFWPNVPGKRPRPGKCTCPENGVSSACPTHGIQQVETSREHLCCTCPSCVWCGEGEHRESSSSGTAPDQVNGTAEAGHSAEKTNCVVSGDGK